MGVLPLMPTAARSYLMKLLPATSVVPIAAHAMKIEPIVDDRRWVSLAEETMHFYKISKKLWNELNGTLPSASSGCP